MRSLVPMFLASIVVLGVTWQAVAQPEAAASEIESARPFIEQTCAHLTSTNPRVRFSAREALANFGGQAVPLIKATREKAENPDVQAFVDRVLVRVRLAGWRSSLRTDPEARKAYVAASRSRPPYDIDRVAMDINLTFAQIGTLEPILRRHFKDVNALWEEFRAAGATKDKGAYEDLNEEIRLLVKAAEPKLRVFLDAGQTEYVKRLMLQLRPGGRVRFNVPEHLREWERDLTERWNARENLTEAEREALMEEWRVFKEEASGMGSGGAGK